MIAIGQYCLKQIKSLSEGDNRICISFADGDRADFINTISTSQPLIDLLKLYQQSGHPLGVLVCDGVLVSCGIVEHDVVKSVSADQTNAQQIQVAFACRPTKLRLVPQDDIHHNRIIKTLEKSAQQQVAVWYITSVHLVDAAFLSTDEEAMLNSILY